MRASHHLLLPLFLLLLCAGACESTLSVSTIQLGRALNADQTVANHTTVFAPNDTVYVSVHTTGTGSGTLSVRWSYAGRVVGEPKKEIKMRGATEFHLQNAGGFPLGEYSVEVFLDGESAGTRTFRVEQR